ncbi:hypothetical protein [Pseudodesulfovibrio sediminis]|uniref:hypothetical protein n=1 Tax=Pseudodesulfovibrio sediminis TaxID=2810563 RepID=UPI001E4FF10F|nr:hypothetical protein [Pseudodesulfovibrio sediminis]
MGELADLIKHSVGKNITVIAFWPSDIDLFISHEKMAKSRTVWQQPTTKKAATPYTRILANQKNPLFSLRINSNRNSTRTSASCQKAYIHIQVLSQIVCTTNTKCPSLTDSLKTPANTIHLFALYRLKAKEDFCHVPSDCTAKRAANSKNRSISPNNPQEKLPYLHRYSRKTARTALFQTQHSKKHLPPTT